MLNMLNHPFSLQRNRGAGGAGISFLLKLALLCLLSACSTLPPASKIGKERQYHQQIDLAGRLSVQYQHNHQPQAAHVRFHWVQTAEQTEVILSSPTGQTLATLLVNAQGARLNQAGQPPRFASDANQLMLDLFGWPLPTTRLRDWLQGFMDPAHQHAMYSKNEDAYYLSDGWNVSYPAWQRENAENNSERPKRIDLRGQNEQGLISVRIVIDEWTPQ